MAYAFTLSDTSSRALFVSGSLSRFLVTAVSIPRSFAIPVREACTGRPGAAVIFAAAARAAAENCSSRLDQSLLGGRPGRFRGRGELSSNHFLSYLVSQL